jgi:hypothetical protein
MHPFKGLFQVRFHLCERDNALVSRWLQTFLGFYKALCSNSIEGEPRVFAGPYEKK